MEFTHTHSKTAVSRSIELPLSENVRVDQECLKTEKGAARVG